MTRIHADRSQGQRRAALEGFKDGSYRVLVATDIAARGIDVADIGHVVNFDLPHVAEDYVHRVGRTARAEASGAASTFVAPEEHDLLRGIERLTRALLPRAEVPRGSEIFTTELKRSAEARGSESQARGAPGHARGAPSRPHAARSRPPRRDGGRSGSSRSVPRLGRRGCLGVGRRGLGHGEADRLVGPEAARAVGRAVDGALAARAGVRRKPIGSWTEAAQAMGLAARIRLERSVHRA